MDRIINGTNRSNLVRGVVRDPFADINRCLCVCGQAAWENLSWFLFRELVRVMTKEIKITHTTRTYATQRYIQM